MNKAGQELGRLSVISRIKKAGGKKKFNEQMQKIAKLPRKKKNYE